MLPGGTGRGNVTTVLLTFVLLVACLGTAIGSVPAGVSGDHHAPPGEPNGVQPGERTHGAAAPESGVVHPDLGGATGEVTVVVRFPELGDAPARGQSRRERGTRMRSHAVDTQAAFDEFVADHAGVTVDRSFWVANAKLVTVDTDAVALDELAAVDGVREIHPNYRIEATSAATGSAVEGTDVTGLETGDGDYRTTYGLQQIRAPAVWERFGTRGAGVSVAVLDSGVDPSHPDVDVDGSRWAEFDDTGDRVDSTPYDSGVHGTHTSGTVAGGNASGTAIGVAPDATLYHGKVLEGDTGTWAAVIAGVEWAATEAEVDVISMSLGAETYYPAFVEPIRQANDLGVVVVASAGNTGEGASNSPGNSYDTVAVGAVDEDREVASFSGGERVRTADAWGSAAPDHWPDEYVVPNVAAPGVDVWSAEPGGGYGYRSGTSMAAPHVAGVVALVRAAGGDHLSQDEMRALLERTAREPAGTPPGKDTRYGAGVVDAYAATALGAADSTVTGRVVDADGDPVAESRVDTEFDYGVATDADGTYRLDVPSLEQTLTVDGFGHEPETVVVAPDSETLERDLVLSNPTLAARTTSTPPERVDPGETVTYEFAVSNVSAVTVDVLAGTRVDRGRTTLRVDGDPVAFGARRTYAEPKGNENVTVEVETTAETVGALELAATFEDGNASITRRTSRTHVHPDPLRVPAAYDPADLQSAVDVAAPGTTIVVDDRTSGPYALSVEEAATGPAGLSIRKPLTVTAAPGSSPVLTVDDPGAADVVAVESTADGVEFSGIAVDGDGADVGFHTTGATSVTDAAVRNATVGFELHAETRARNVSLDGRAVAFDARDVAVSTTAAPAPAPDDHERAGPALDVAVVGDSPRADLAVGYDADATRLREETIRTWRYDEAAGEWTVVADSWIETADRRVVASLDHFGTVAPIGERQPAEFVVDDVETPDAVVAGETVTANATVTNTGSRTATGDVELRLGADPDGEAAAGDYHVLATDDLSLAAGASTTVTFTVDVPAADDIGSLQIGVFGPDGGVQAPIEVSSGGGTDDGGTDEGETDDGGSDGSTGGSGGGGSGGGGSGGGGATPAPPSPPEDGDEADDETDTAGDEADGPDETAAIVDGAPDRPGVSVALRNSSVSEITFRDGDATGSVTVREGVDDGLARPPGTAVAHLSIGVPAALTDRPATIRASVEEASVDGGELTMYRHADGAWQPLETTVSRSGESLVVTAETPGFSRFALVRTDAASTPADDRSTAADGPTPTEPSSTSSSPTETDATTQSTPAESASPTEDDGAGLGVGAALLAAVVGLLVARRATR